MFRYWIIIPHIKTYNFSNISLILRLEREGKIQWDNAPCCEEEERSRNLESLQCPPNSSTSVVSELLQPDSPMPTAGVEDIEYFLIPS